jgi:hypothetical protein
MRTSCPGSTDSHGTTRLRAERLHQAPLHEGSEVAPRKTAPTIADPDDEARVYNLIRTYRRRPGDADVDATRQALDDAWTAHSEAVLRSLADNHETLPGPGWQPRRTRCLDRSSYRHPA